MLLYKSLKSMAAMMASVRCGPRLLMIVAAVAVLLAIAVVVIAMGVMGIAMAIKANGMKVGRIAAIVYGIAVASRFVQKESLIGRVDGVDYAELFSPETGDPSKNQVGDIRRNGWLLFLLRGMVVGPEILIQC
uniref:Uncharacterized protein n=1 Tax=Romanomermis culicivorax TaxID=13658 RepID=A0A915KHE7_ROMCU